MQDRVCMQVGQLSRQPEEACQGVQLASKPPVILAHESYPPSFLIAEGCLQLYIL